MKLWQIVSIVILCLIAIYDGYVNYTIYKLNGEINLGLNGSINSFLAGSIMFCIAVIALLTILYLSTRKARKESKNPSGMVPVSDEQDF